MSNQLAIATVTAAIERIVAAPVEGEVGGAMVAAGRPRDTTADLDADPGITVFLTSVVPATSYTPNGEDLPTRRGNGQLAQRPRIALELGYLLLAYGDPARHEPERLLGVAARELHAHPIVDRDLIAAVRDAADPPAPTAPVHPHLADTDLDEEIEQVKLTLNPVTPEETSGLWTALQARYVPSLSYRASVVFIVAESTPTPSLPVLEPAVHIVALRSPVIDGITSVDGPGQPIFATGAIAIEGRDLRGDTTLVRIAGETVTPDGATNARVTARLAQLPAGDLRPGPQPVRIVHRLAMGSPPEPHEGETSNEARFTLQPTVTGAGLGNVAPAPSGNGFDGEVEIDTDLTIDADEAVVLRLTPIGATADGGAIVRRTIAPDRDGDGTTLTIPFASVAGGTYLAQIEVAGAESQIERDASGEITGPAVVIS